MNESKIPDLIAEIKDELDQLDKLSGMVVQVWTTLPDEPAQRLIHEESLALKLHNFYTGCERIFKNIAKDINGGVPDSFDWHRRLLHTMSLNLENIRPAVISRETETALSEFLSFRHVVRNIYGFTIDSGRLENLMRKFDTAYQLFKKDMIEFIALLASMQE